RRVSFNLGCNSVLQLPSNTAITKISQARSRRRSSIAGSADSADGLGLAELAKQADRRAQALLPHGASLALLDSRYAMTALCVKRGLICAMNDTILGANASSDSSEGEHGDGALSQLLLQLPPAPAKGVLKPFAPSPVNAKFLAGGLLEENPEAACDSETLPEDALVPGSASVPAQLALEDQQAPRSAGHPASRKAKRQGKKKSQLKSKRHQRLTPSSNGDGAGLQSQGGAMPTPATVTRHGPIPAASPHV
ncbi:hypothetical protein LPJ61_005075, partial [Coemansia biformis]